MRARFKLKVALESGEREICLKETAEVDLGPPLDPVDRVLEFLAPFGWTEEDAAWLLSRSGPVQSEEF